MVKGRGELTHGSNLSFADTPTAKVSFIGSKHDVLGVIRPMHMVKIQFIVFIDSFGDSAENKSGTHHLHHISQDSYP